MSSAPNVSRGPVLEMHATLGRGNGLEAGPDLPSAVVAVGIAA
jgi:hypothetical protein